MKKIFVLILLFSILLFTHLHAQKKEYWFKYLTTNNGLSHSFVTAIVQDKDGFMWFGTQDGLNKYDGNNFIVYRSIFKNSKSISHNFIRKLFIDHKGILWVGTQGGGLSRFEKETSTFINYTNDPINPQSISQNIVLGIDEDAKGNIWVATSEGGIDCLDIHTGIFNHFKPGNDTIGIKNTVVRNVLVDKSGNIWIATRGKGLDRMKRPGVYTHYLFNPSDPASISSNDIKDLYEDKKGNIWIGTDGAGLNLFNPKTNTFTRYLHDANNSQTLCNNYVLSITEDKGGNIWVGTENGGISILQRDKKTFIHLDINHKNNYSLSNNSIHSLLCDTKGNMWVGTYSGGVNFLSVEPEKFIHYKNDSYNPNSLNNNNVLSLGFIDTTSLLIGTDGGGLNIFDIQKNLFTHFIHTTKTSSISSNYVLSVLQDSDKDIWTGSYKGGLSLFNKSKGTFYNFKADGTAKSCSDNSVGYIIQDKKGYLWIAYYGQGISRYDKRNKLFKHYLPNSNSPSIVFTLLADSKGNIWAGTEGGGLNLLDQNTQSFTRFKHLISDKTTISNDIVNCLFEDSKHNLWIGTNDGLNLFDPKTTSFKSFFIENGLPNNTILGIIEDNKGCIWLGTNKGISKYNPITGLFKNYTLTDGIQSNSFNRNSCFKDVNGKIYFGGVNGFNIFNPDSIHDDLSFPPTFLTGFKLFNKSIQVGDKDSILKKDIRYTRTVTLEYDQSFISIEFIALNYSTSENNHYAYKLEGFNNDWIYVGNNKSATYTNLNPGKYIFKVKASNNDGQWGDKVSSLELIIKPPFWLTWWFKLLLVGSLIFTVIFIFNLRTLRIRRKNKWLYEEVKQRTREINNQKEEILVQKNNIEEKSKNLSDAYESIQDSIQYAKTIQDGMLPNVSEIQQVLKEIFILFKPRNIVSGDFYWFAKRNGKIVIAAVDCTGHGVPGAFMSMVGNAVLNQIINVDGITDSDKILFELNKGIRSALKQDVTGSRDGMDIALCVIDKEIGTLQYSGAFNPLYYIQNDELFHIKPDNISIGGGKKREDTLFTKHTIDISIPTTFYIFSDGFQDQVGGANNLKFMKVAFRKLLLEIYTQPMEKQKSILESTIDAWMLDQDQRDDILIIGVRV